MNQFYEYINPLFVLHTLRLYLGNLLRGTRGLCLFHDFIDSRNRHVRQQS